MKKNRKTALNVRKKNIQKVRKSIIQAIILAALAVLLIQTIFNIEKYEEPDRSAWSQKDGFIALSYFGVGRTGSAKLVDKDQLEDQLQALYDQGYVTISQQDVIDYYSKGKALPDKALFLSFEDGRNDSGLFAQPLLEKLNYKATFLSYANKVGNSERKFVQPKEMKKMTDTGFWELGSNGYRLSYINIFDDEGRFIGARDESELPDKSEIEYYNHYLMDFIRDKNMIPVEDREQMESRIKNDYDLMQNIYTDSLGYVPGVYMIMHANALGEGMNRLVTNANEENIRELFNIHFNREGTSLNTLQDSIYNLNRVQPAPYWATNHLLMKIMQDTGETLQFVQGDEDEAKNWSLIEGAAEFKEGEIVLTSPAGGIGKLELRESLGAKNAQISFQAAGNVVGRQGVYIRNDEQKESYVRVDLVNNRLRVVQKVAGHEAETIYEEELDPVNWSYEDLAYDKASVYTKVQTTAGDRDAEDEYPINIADHRQFDISLQDQKLSVTVDDKLWIDQLRIDDSIEEGTLALYSAYHKQNKKDTIYDGIFKQVTVYVSEPGEDAAAELYSNIPHGWERASFAVRRAFDSAVDWAVETF
ncbi:polysaccharide deacetylase family protein [Neobacillus mesonae]|nr:polysaccharide deacetylase family protein [Neobacillus mesonae]